MLYNLAEWARERLAGWAAQSKADTTERAVKEYAEPSTAAGDTGDGPAAKVLCVLGRGYFPEQDPHKFALHGVGFSTQEHDQGPEAATL